MITCNIVANFHHWYAKTFSFVIQIIAARQQNPSQFASYFELDEDDIDAATEEEIQSKRAGPLDVTRTRNVYKYRYCQSRWHVLMYWYE